MIKALIRFANDEESQDFFMRFGLEQDLMQLKSENY
jgi:hypothetical protein